MRTAVIFIGTLFGNTQNPRTKRLKQNHRKHLINNYLSSQRPHIDSVHKRLPFRPCAERKVAMSGKEGVRSRHPERRQVTVRLSEKQIDRGCRLSSKFNSLTVAVSRPSFIFSSTETRLFTEYHDICASKII